MNLIEILKRYSFSIQGIGLILCLHRVSNIEEESLNDSLVISLDNLNEIIDKFKRSGYTFLSFDDFIVQVRKNSKAKKLITITFDDGYKDNFTLAYPYFRSKGIPFLIYLTTSYLEGKSQPWWYALEEYINSEDEKKDKSDSVYFSLNDDEKRKLFTSWRNEILSSEENKNQIMQDLFLNFDWNALNRKLFLSWEDAHAMQKSNLVSFGSHTLNHPNLAVLRSEEVYNELLQSKLKIENKLGTRIDHFCYPYGSRNECGYREFQIAEQVGYISASTTRFGNIFHDHKTKLFSLPRISFSNNFRFYNYKKALLRRFFRGAVVGY